MQSTSSIFIHSSVPVKENLVKSILFRASAIALQYAVLKLCAYIAYLKSEYTSFLMFAENLIQQALFIASRGMQRSAIIVLIFTASFTLANIYDTVLWALDSPGYVVRSNLVNGSAVLPHLLQNPSYVSTIRDPSKDPDRIDLSRTLTSDLFKPSFSFSFPPTNYTWIPEAILPPAPMNPDYGYGARIYLDEEGLGVSFGRRMIGDQNDCPLHVLGTGNTASWWCTFPGNVSMSFLDYISVGEPVIWWENHTERTAFLSPSRTDNTWASISTGPETAVMKQVFTVTKGNRRHTFLETIFQASMTKPAPGVIAEDEIKTLFHRLYATEDSTVLADLMAKRCIDQQASGVGSVSTGTMSQIPSHPSILLLSTDFINLSGVDGSKLSGILHSSEVFIQLIRSETIPEPIQPSVPCDVYNYDEARGGRVRWNDCKIAFRTNQTGAHFLGRVDTSAVAIVVDILGDGTSDTTPVALNSTGLRWYLSNSKRIDQLLLSRALLIGGDPDSIKLVVHRNEAAISYLQLLLICVPFVLALSAYALMLRDKPGYYKRSLFASLATTTHIGEARSCESVGYSTNPPTLVLHLPESDHVRIGTKDRYILLRGEQGLGNDVGTER